MTTSQSVKRSLSKTINAPAEKVFDSWLIPAVIGRWMVGPAVQAEQIVALENTVRPRGDFSFSLTRGNQNTVLSGVYRIIDRPSRLEFSWCEDAAEVIVLALFEADAAGHTKVRISLTLPTVLATQADDIKRLWQERCIALATLLNK